MASTQDVKLLHAGGHGADVSFLAPVPAIMVRQKLQVLEQFLPIFEKQNFYRIGQCDAGALANPPDGDAFNSMTPSFVAQESSTCCCRVFCGSSREFSLLISQAAGPDAPGQALLRLERPFKCTITCFGSICNPQELTVTNNQGEVIGTVAQDWSCSRCCEFACFPGGFSYFAVKGKGGETQFYLRHKFPTICNGCVNFCAPSCCNKVFELDILDADGTTVLSQMKSVFPGITCRWVSDASNFVMAFPPKATPEQKALLMGALFLAEYVYFEKKPEDDNTSSVLNLLS